MKRSDKTLREIRAATPKQPALISRWLKHHHKHSRCVNTFLLLHENHGGSRPPMLPPWQSLPPVL